MKFLTSIWRMLGFANVVLAVLISGPSFAASLVRGPYLQNLTTATVTIVWTTNVASDSRVDYGLSIPYASSVRDPASVTQHAIVLTSLTQALMYHYQVFSGGNAITPDLLFHSGKGSGFRSFTFAATGDHRTNPTAHTAVAKRIQAIDPEIVIDVGDLTTDGNVATNWDPEFFTPEKDVMSRACMFLAIGNHDGTGGNYLNYFYAPKSATGTGRYYSFDYANAHFACLDNYSAYTAGSPQYTWLEADLAANQTRDWTFVFFHQPPYSSGSHGSDLAVRSTLVPLFEKYGVDVVFNGHDHDYERGQVNGVYYIVTGGGGAPPGAVGANTWTQFSSSQYECCKVSIAQRDFVMQVVAPDGTVIDTLAFSAPELPTRADREWTETD